MGTMTMRIDDFTAAAVPSRAWRPLATKHVGSRHATGAYTATTSCKQTAVLESANPMAPGSPGGTS